MRRSIIVILTAGLLLLAIAMPAAAAKPEAIGPPCAEIEVTANYVTDPDTGTPTVTFLFDLPLASCAQVTYSAFVYDETGANLIVSDSVAGDGGQIGFAFELPGGPSRVCVSASSSSAGGSVFDAAPDTGCVQLMLSAGGGAQKFT